MKDTLTSKRFLGVLLVLFASAPAIDPVLAQRAGRQGHMMWNGMMGPMNWFGMILMIVVGVLLLIGLVLLVKWLIMQSRAEATQAPAQSASALEILKQRYARGEIDKQEFEEKKKDLLS